MRCPKCSEGFPEGTTKCPNDGSELLDETLLSKPEDLELRGLADQADEDDHDLVGKVLDGRYRIIERLGSGGMGKVYLAEQLNIARQVAIKVMSSQVADADLVARFESEAKIISQLRHPNTLKLFDFGQTPEGMLYIVTELLSGSPLSSILNDGPLGAKRTFQLLKEVCRSLEEAHARGIIHRDLKPANIFVEVVSDHELVKVLDFGIAKVGPKSKLLGENVDAHETAHGTLIGTPSYISPEQALNREVDPRSDLYSMGVVAYACLAGRLPFTGELFAILNGHTSEPPPPFSQTAPNENIDPRAEELVMRLLSKNPADRPQSATELFEEIDALLGQLDQTVAEDDDSPGSLWAAGVVVAVLVIAAGIYFVRDFSVFDVGVEDDLSPTSEYAVDAAVIDGGQSPRRDPGGAVLDVIGRATGIRVYDHRLLAGWSNLGEVKHSLGRLQSDLISCHLKTQKGEHSSRTISVRIVRRGNENLFKVGAPDQAGKNFRTCLETEANRAHALPTPEGEEGIVEVKVGPRGKKLLGTNPRPRVPSIETSTASTAAGGL